MPDRLSWPQATRLILIASAVLWVAIVPVFDLVLR